MSEQHQGPCPECWIGWAREVPKGRWKAVIEIYAHVGQGKAQEAFDIIALCLGESVSTILLPANQTPGKQGKT